VSLVEEARAVRQRIAQRLAELEPLVREYNELVTLAGEMGVEQPRENEPSAPAARARASGSTRTGRRGGGTNARGSNAGTGRAGNDIAGLVLEAVRAEPGKTVADYADALNMSATTLYRPVRQLTDEGALVKRVRQLFPA
jgi:Winged helix-turn-helix DNA-binding